MKKVYKRVSGTPMTEEQRRELEAFVKTPNRTIDLSDAPPLPESAWKDAVRGKFYRPIKKAVSMRLDADLLEWLKKDGRGYQTRANEKLRELMMKELRASRKKAA